MVDVTEFVAYKGLQLVVGQFRIKLVESVSSQQIVLAREDDLSITLTLSVDGSIQFCTVLYFQHTHSFCFRLVAMLLNF